MVTTNLDSPSTFDLKSYLADRRSQVEAAIDRILPVVYPETIYESMRYSLMAGGKRLRPILCLATCELLGADPAIAMPTACALEMVHTMSLIHDDLPAMDNDDYRRGQLTNHKVYGEDVAVLAGDALLAYAFELIATQTPQGQGGAQPQQILKVVAQLGRAVGADGLVGGQIVDLASEGTAVDEQTLTYIHMHKTAALLEVSVTAGAILAGADSFVVERLSRYAQRIGLAFQIVDDVLDITSTAETLGKTVGKDVAAQKATYPSLWGLEASQRKAQQLVSEANAELAGFDHRALPLMAIARYITARTH
ncbi:geranylgeranyl diphosphate synthase CrtE [Leptolyngbya sp. BC1307]|uniref:geranylgeranyl diphosphate synthase CrtE n=1 Tax=Leptolyngbya sp. BC1307 TaxID=2029589 RepID=UPI000EFAB153|nr:farnesyl diphosphate synthase [Leptolyngbya sp. BC1307]